MPFTPFHFGLHATIGLPLRRYIDVPIFILASVAVDLEPLAVMVFNLSYPLHGYCHTFLFGALVGLAWGVIGYGLRGSISAIMKALRIGYEPSLNTALRSGILGVWLHIFLDMPLYDDIRPFFPWSANPLLGMVSDNTIYSFGAAMFIPALLLYWSVVHRYRGRKVVEK